MEKVLIKEIKNNSIIITKSSDEEHSFKDLLKKRDRLIEQVERTNFLFNKSLERLNAELDSVKKLISDANIKDIEKDLSNEGVLE